MPRQRKKIIDVASAIVILALVMLDAAMWNNILITPPPDGVTLLVNASASSSTNIVNDASYIDLAVILSPRAADYQGYRSLLQHDRVGAFLYNGRADSAHTAEWQELLTAIAQKHIPLVTVGAGDKIRYASNEIDILSPDATFARSPDPAQTAITWRVITPSSTATSERGTFLLYNK
ncbi:MAG TPA: hypothetical protein VIJ29_00335 [Candidatus Paceibacterota bacterium]